MGLCLYHSWLVFLPLSSLETITYWCWQGSRVWSSGLEIRWLEVWLIFFPLESILLFSLLKPYFPNSPFLSNTMLFLPLLVTRGLCLRGLPGSSDGRESACSYICLLSLLCRSVSLCTSFSVALIFSSFFVIFSLPPVSDSSLQAALSPTFLFRFCPYCFPFLVFS